MDGSRVTVIKGSCTSKLSCNETVAKQKMTGLAMLQSYLENSFAYWRYGGGSFVILDINALFQLSFQKLKWKNTYRGKKRKMILVCCFLWVLLPAKFDREQERQRESV